MIAIFMERSLFDVDVTMDELSGSSLEASVAGLGQKAGTLTDLSNLEGMCKILKLLFFMGPLTCMLLSFTSQNKGH